MRRAAPAGFAAAMALAACTVGPDYKAPPQPAGAAGPLVSLDPRLESAGEASDAWWRLYADPRLDALVQEALVANTDLKAAQANLTAARAALLGARAGRYPGTELEFGAIKGRDPVTDEILEIVGAKPQTIWLYDDLIDVSYELDLFGRVTRSIQAARADAQAAAAARDAVRVTVAAETARAYAQACALGEELAAARRSLEIAQSEAKIISDRREAGAGADFDVVRAQAVASQTASSIPGLEGQRRSALFELTALLGRTPRQAPQEVENCQSAPRPTAPIPVGDGASLIARRPDVRLAERRLASATARIGVATADLYPRVTLGAFYGGAAAQLSQLTQNAGLAWGVGPKISWAFPNQAPVRARIRAARAGADAALDQFDGAVLKALKEVEQALATYSAELDRHAALGETLERTRRAFEIAREEQRNGAIATLDLLTAEQSLASAESQFAASDAAIANDQVTLFKALGGGWRDAPQVSSR